MEKPPRDQYLFHKAHPVSGHLPRHLQVGTGDAPSQPSTASPQSPSTLSPSPPAREIVLVLRPPAPADPPPSPDQATILTPAQQFQLRDREGEQTPQDERFCIQLWVLWAALTLPLVFSMWLFLLPFLINSNTTLLPAEPPFWDSTSVTSVFATAPVTMSVTVPAACLKPVTLPVMNTPISVNPNPSRGPSTRSLRPFFCVFRNAEVAFSRTYSTAGTNFDFTFETLPFDLCHYVIYSSVGIDNGNITSRMPSFDQLHGLHQLRNITDSLGFFNVKILLALGGYREDGPHFSKLGRDPVTLNRLTANVVAAMRSFHLNGVAVHWVFPGPNCSGPDDQGTIAALLRKLRQAFDNNGMPQAIVSAMLNGRDSIERLMLTSKDAVDYFFLTDPRPFSDGMIIPSEICSSFTRIIILTLNYYVDNVPGLRREQICAAEPLGLFALDGDIDMATRQFIPLRTGGLRWAPIYEACGKRRFCRVEGTSQSCIVHLITRGFRPNSTTHQGATMYFNDLSSTLYGRFKTRAQPPISGEPCTFVTLAEYDNYAGQCGSRYNPHLLMRHLYLGALDQDLFHKAHPASRHQPQHLQLVTSYARHQSSTAALQSPSTTSPSPPPAKEIVLVLRPPAPPNPAQSPDQATIPTTDQQPQLQHGEGEQTPQDERFCIQLWVLGAALTLPLVFSMWLFLLPFLINSNTTLLPTGPPIWGSTSVTSVLAVTVQATCLKPVALPVINMPISVNPNPPRGPSTQSLRPFFCVFKNTAVGYSRNFSTAGTNFDFTFETLPFDLCHYVIYWSVGIDNGNITSRLPSYDQRHGLNRLRSITDSLGFFSVKILLALGGYPEDGPHFSKLGRDPGTLNRLTANVVDAMRVFHLNGVAVHWVYPGADCSGPDDHGTVAALLRMLRQAFNKNGMPQAIVSAMLDGRDTIERLMFYSKDAVDYFFLTDHRRFPNGSSNPYEICSTFTHNIILTLKYYLNNVPGLRREQICAAEPVASFALDGVIDMGTGQFIPSQAGVFRWAPIYEACGKPRFCRVAGTSQSCIVHYANWGSRNTSTTHQAATMYFNDLTSALYARFNTRSQPPIRGEPCTLATLAEYDNYAGQCGSRYNPHLLMRHLYFGALGGHLHNGSIDDAAPPYHPSVC
ncbi:hypothetical protein HPB49_013175 [Dermacentor silvarum]|uniref:Uncharacterized protein n=1 Tax=Dermacentor silvarum TaxID=543639 RepID=A0ACB8C3R6_DERSI|nr:hypothetical protein HPB49_013175 [Dermacentor silvarum]